VGGRRTAAAANATEIAHGASLSRRGGRVTSYGVAVSAATNDCPFGVPKPVVRS
jgi:hypothetical protein